MNTCIRPGCENPARPDETHCSCHESREVYERYLAAGYYNQRPKEPTRG